MSFQYNSVRNQRSQLIRSICVGGVVAFSSPTYAINVDTGVQDLRVRFDNTIKYSAAFRLNDQDEEVIAAYNPNLDDGDYNFDKGLTSNRLDLLSEFDLVYQNRYGFRLSGAAWYDTVYSDENDNPGFQGGAVPNNQSVPFDEFTDDTRRVHGRNAEVLDAFVFGRTYLGETELSARLGRHSLLWGESLFFGSNGIAGAQAPVDFVKLLSIPNSQFKEVIRPVNQFSTELTLTPTISVGAFYQFEWEENRVPAVGSYLSRNDLLDEGGELFNLPAAFGGPVPRGDDQDASDSGQFGVQFRWFNESINTDFGLYAVRFHDKNPIVYVRPGQDYRLTYAEDIDVYGLSASHTFGSFNVAGEVSVRRDTPLVPTGGAVFDFVGDANNTDNPLYPIGNTAHAQISTIHSLSRNDLWDGGLLLAEIAWNRVTSATENGQFVDPNADRDAVAFRMLFEPTLYQVTSGVDMGIPIGLGYTNGRSSAIQLFNGGFHNGGDMSLGLSFDIQQKYKAGITYTHYYGESGGILDESGNYSFKQSFKDRDYISLSIQTTL